MSAIAGMEVINTSDSNTGGSQKTVDERVSEAQKNYANAANIKTDLDRPFGLVFEENQNLKDVQNDFNKGIRETSDQAVSDMEDLYRGVRNTPGTELDEKYGTDFAKEGRYGNLNNKSFDDTLRLSRQADAYNNKPIGKMHLGISYNPSAGQGVGGFETIGYERPKLETQEMRQMRANERLDEMQRGLDVQLQHNITKLPYDAFVKALDNKFGIRVSEADARRAFEQIRAVDRANQKLMKDTKDFNSRYQYKFGMAAGKVMAELAKTNTLQSIIVSNYVFGMPPIPIKDYYTYEFLDPFLRTAIDEIKNDPSLSYNEKVQAIQRTINVCGNMVGQVSDEEAKKFMKLK